ncbi:unnamed protein product [Urochloa decumbens]|uniref:Ubiquitin-like domain-containing protein n=1 Tax=Urochloa decumbens TaxID=240449 RepID=A0ABC9C229_9POAL
MASDSAPQEPPPPWLAAAAGASEQKLLLVSLVRERRRGRALLADEEGAEQADAVHHGVDAGHAIAPTAEGSSEETTTSPATVLLLLPSEVVESFSKEALGRLCKGSSASATLLLPLERARAQIVSPADTSTEHLMSYLQDPKSVRLLAEKTKEIWKVSYIDGVEECFTTLPMHLLVAEENISAPTKRLHCNSVVGEVLQVSSEETKTGSATALLLLPSEVVGSFSKEVLGRLWDTSLQKNQALKKDSFNRLSDNESDDSKERISVVPAGNGAETENAVLPLLFFFELILPLLPQPKCGPLLEPSSFCLIELQSDQQSPRSSHTTHINVASAQDIDRQQLSACSKSNAQIQKNDESSRGDTERQLIDASRNRCQKVPIFIKHCSGKVVLTVKLDEPSEHMMHLYEKQTKMKLVHQYFKYGNYMIDPKCSLLSYGVGRNATVDACSRLLGGRCPTLEEYFHDKRNDKKNDILVEVTLPDEKVSLEMTVEGCRILSTWLSCFMWAFSQGKSWGGIFTLKDFYVLDGHVRFSNDNAPKRGCASGSMEKDIQRLLEDVKKIFSRNRSKLVSEYPPFLKNLIDFLENLRMTETISRYDRLFIETHVSCTTSSSWGMLLYKLHRRYKGLIEAEKDKWDAAISSARCPHEWYARLSKMIVFKDMIKQANKDKTNIGAFTLMRDTVMHALDLDDKKPVQKKYQNADNLALMIPVHMLDFLPNIIENLIKKDIDISAELHAAKVPCFCNTCAPSS